MAEFTDDLSKLFVDASVGTTANILISSKVSNPLGDGPFLHIRETGGAPGDYTQDKTAIAYEYPTVQILVRAKDYVVARAMLKAAYDAVQTVQNVELNGTWYLWLRPLQRFIDLGLDATGRAQVAFNVMANKRP